jgi:hypothetical protein
LILDLSIRWEFSEIKNLAIRELEKKEIPDSKRIKLYDAYQLDKNILIPRYAALCERDAYLTLEEGEDIGLETALMIAAAREEVRASRLAAGSRSPLSLTVRGAELHDLVRKVFQIAPKSEQYRFIDDYIFLILIMLNHPFSQSNPHHQFQPRLGLHRQISPPPNSTPTNSGGEQSKADERPNSKGRGKQASSSNARGNKNKSKPSVAQGLDGSVVGTVDSGG